MNNFERFQERNKLRASSNNKNNSSFIKKGYNSTTIRCGEISLTAAVVNEQEKKSAYIYTFLNEPLEIGSVWETKNLHFLITEEIITIKDVDYHKYLSCLCNCNINGYWGYFIGPEEKYVSITLKNKSIYTSNQQPVLVLSDKLKLNFGDKILIKNRAWVIQEYDAISTPGVVYYSIAPTTMSKDVDSVELSQNAPLVKPQIAMNDTYFVNANEIISLPTTDAYFKTNNSNLKIVSRKPDEIKFYLPFGVDNITIETKEGDDISSRTYRLID